MNHRDFFIRHCLTLLTLVLILWVVPSASAQQPMSPQAQGQPSPSTPQPQPLAPQGDPDVTRHQLANFDRFLDSHPDLAQQLRKDPTLINNEEFVENHADLQQFLQQHPELREEFQENPNGFMHQEQRFDRREEYRELARMDQFLDQHPQLAQQLRQNPSLINNEEFVENHPDLQQFLQQHPEICQELQQNPNAFMRQEQRFDRQEDRNTAQRGDADITHHELGSFDRFLDGHPEIAEQLRKNPSLVDNQDFVNHHPALQEYLQTHAGVREELGENPSAFMQAEARFDQREDFRGDRDLNRTELANMDRFLNEHPEIAEQLRKKPSLVNDKSFLQHHQALQQFLAEHPGVREEFKENPSGFMQAEAQFDLREGNGMGRDRDMTRGLSSFHEFLEGHGQIAGELSKNPSLAKNEEYIENHPELQQYLKAHPEVHQQLNENPQSFLQSAQQFASARSTHQVNSSKNLTNLNK